MVGQKKFIILQHVICDAGRLSVVVVVVLCFDQESAIGKLITLPKFKEGFRLACFCLRFVRYFGKMGNNMPITPHSAVNAVRAKTTTLPPVDGCSGRRPPVPVGCVGGPGPLRESRQRMQ